MKLRRILSEPPEGIPGGRVEQEEEGDEEEKEGIGEVGRRRKQDRVVRRNVKEQREEDQMEDMETAL